MKILDYGGLSRLVANITGYIANRLAPVDARTTYYCEGMWFGFANNFMGPGAVMDGYTVALQGNETLTASSTGAAKKMYDRFMKGFPAALMVKASYPTSAAMNIDIPFILVKGYGNGRTRNIGLYYSPMATVNGNYNTLTGQGVNLKVEVDLNAKTVKLSHNYCNMLDYIDHPDYDSQLPCPWLIQSIAADGTVVNAGTKTLSATSTGDALTLYNRLQKGMPPSIVVDMATSTGETRKVYCYLDAITASGNTYQYVSGTLANGSFSGKQAQVNIALSTMRVSLLMKSVSATASEV